MTPEQWNTLAKKINVIFVLSDIQESLIVEVEGKMKPEGELRFEVKKYVNDIKKASRLLVEHVNRHAAIHNEDFAHDAEKVKEIIDKEFEL